MQPVAGGGLFDEFEELAVFAARAVLLGQLLPALRQLLQGLGVRRPVFLARRFQHALDDLRLGLRMVFLEPLLHAELVLVVDIHGLELVPLVVTHGFRCGHLPAPQVVGGVEDFQCAAVALLLHLLDPAGVEVAGTQVLGEEAGGGFAARVVGIAQVGNEQLGRLAAQVPHGQADTAEILERIVGSEHPVEIRRPRQHRALHALEMFGVGIDRTLRPPSGGIRAVGELHALQVETGQLALAFAARLAACCRFAPGIRSQGSVAQPRAIGT
ncbi:hypothetical protein D3C80_1069980 [compost metagenome]